MSLDPQVRNLLDAVEAMGFEALHTLSVEEARKRADAMVDPDTFPEYDGRIEGSSIPGPGGDLRIRVFTPKGDAPFPMIMFFHGGGFVLGGLDSHEPICRLLSQKSGAIVISVDYRLAPEHKFPAAVEDCLTATRWASENAASLNGDAARLAVSGDSAGGNLATVVAMRIRNEGGPALRGQLLIYPVADHYEPGTQSYRDNAEGYFLTRKGMQWFIDHYLPSSDDADHPHFSLLRGADLHDLPPACVITAEYDPLRDEGDLLAARLRDAGVETVHQPCEGMIHGFYTFVGMVDKSEEVVNDSCRWLKNVLNN
ncbi:MAG: alpha/beta hydrolase [Gammaproteobacteria bacterium]